MEPSLEDKDVTDRMYQAGRFLDLPIIDHLIIDEEKFYSFADSGLLRKISMSKKYVMPFKQEEERLKNLGHKKGKHEGRLEKAVEMAKAMKKKESTSRRLRRFPVYRQRRFRSCEGERCSCRRISRISARRQRET